MEPAPIPPLAGLADASNCIRRIEETLNQHCLLFADSSAMRPLAVF